MWEFLIATALVGVLAGMGLMHRFVPWFILLQIGAWVIVVGTALSVAAGFVYHVALYRTLQPRALLRERWWLNPTPYHAALEPHERPQVLSWFYLGAAAFGVVMLGCVTVLLAVWRID